MSTFPMPNGQHWTDSINPESRPAQTMNGPLAMLQRMMQGGFFSMQPSTGPDKKSDVYLGLGDINTAMGGGDRSANQIGGFNIDIPFIKYDNPNNGMGLTEESQDDAGSLIGGTIGTIYGGSAGYQIGSAAGSFIEDLISGNAEFDFSGIKDLFSF